MKTNIYGPETAVGRHKSTSKYSQMVQPSKYEFKRLFLSKKYCFWSLGAPRVIKIHKTSNYNSQPCSQMSIMPPSHTCAGQGSDSLLCWSKMRLNDSVRIIRTLRKSKTKQKSPEINRDDRGLYHSQIRRHNTWFRRGRSTQSVLEQKINGN